MQPNKVLKYVLDIESIIREIEEVKNSVDNNFEVFKKDVKAIRTVERQLEIIGEAVNKINQLDPGIQPSSDMCINEIIFLI